MSDNSFYKTVRDLKKALENDFKGFLIPNDDGSLRKVEVPEGELHILKAIEEMSTVPGWKYTSGIGQDPIAELMKEKRAIYVSRFNENDENALKVVAYINEVHQDEVEYRGRHKEEHVFLGEISSELGYEVDEYGPVPKKDGSGIIYVPINHIESKNQDSNIHIQHNLYTRRFSEGDKPVFDSNNNLFGVIRGGKFTRISDYARYSPHATKHFKKNIESKRIHESITIENVVKNAVGDGITNTDVANYIQLNKENDKDEKLSLSKD